MANTIQDKLAYLEETKRLIKEAIVAKGVEITDTDTFRSYVDKISSIQTGSGGTVNIPDGTKFGYSKFTTIPVEILPYLETQTDMSFMFVACSNLETIPLLNVSNTTNISFIFYDCPSLTNLGGLTGLKQDLDLTYSSKLTVDSVMNVITNAEDMTSSPKTLTLHQDVFNRLSQEQIATATAKGWNIAAD